MVHGAPDEAEIVRVSIDWVWSGPGWAGREWRAGFRHLVRQLKVSR